MRNYVDAQRKVYSNLLHKRAQASRIADELQLPSDELGNLAFAVRVGTRRNQPQRFLTAKREDGSITTEPVEVRNTFRTHFERFFAQEPQLDDCDFESRFLTFCDGLPKLKAEDTEGLHSPATKDEVSQALKAMNARSAPGPDGILTAFYVRFFEILGDLLTYVVNIFINEGKKPLSFRDGRVVLLMKEGMDRSNPKYRHVLSLYDGNAAHAQTTNPWRGAHRRSHRFSLTLPTLPLSRSPGHPQPCQTCRQRRLHVMAMANSDQLRKKRGALRAGVTRALTQLTDLLQQTDPDLSEVSVQVDYLKDRESALSTLDDAMLALTDEENLDREVETAQDYSDKISYAIARAKYWLQERQQATRTHAQASGSGSSNLELPNSVDAPDQVREQRQRSTPEDRIRRAKDLLTFLRIQVEVREEGRLQLRRRPHESEKMSMATESTGGAEHIPSAASLTSSAVSVNEVCPLCNSSGHSIISCNATLSADDKRVRLRNNNCCFRCGTRNHIARLCKKSYSLTCGTCRRRHLTILCELSRPVEGLPPTAESVALGRPSLPSLRTVTTAQSTHIGSTAVLLQTGRIWAECGTRRLLVRVLLDSGSQRSYIREDAARKLQCSVVGREELTLITFGNSKSQRRLRAERVSVRPRSQFDDAAVELEALTIPEICSVTSPPLENNILQRIPGRKTT
ncbi:hypothetical protein HPB52_006417 [Rhipicephalus sanguineus]|uniref:CCHC-type domain-containing protein n=1 Tax=Rhipicephalus sanguineus TaxID=34632 RepID=A0A9D4PBR8_RHISA|nr:hypothetical protein HPB52_006417 [Rhipicephalus sanguineus]